MNMRLNAALFSGAIAAILLTLSPVPATAQAVYREDFTTATTSHNWYFFNGACLTAGTALASNPGTGNGCTAIGPTYYQNEPLVGGYNGATGPTQTLPDPSSKGALRLTNGCTKESGKNCNDSTVATGAASYVHTLGGGHHQNGAIISADTFNASAGISVTFKTVTYRGDSGGGDGADGISFILMDGATDLTAYTDNFGAFGGSLGYTCTNQTGNYDFTLRSDSSVRGFDGMVGGYIGLGIDEYGNYLNGVTNTLGETDSSGGGDNTASGGLFKSNRIGLRGRGNISWKWLHANYPAQYPNSLLTISDGTYQTKAGAAVHNACYYGKVYDYSAVTKSSQNGVATTTTLDDYAALPNAYKVLSGLTIANEAAVKRGSTTVANTDTSAAYPITYNLKITTNGLLSLSYSYNGGTYQPVITNQTIANGTQPSSFRFGFAGSTGGASNIHEILCFKAAPSETSNSSGGINVYQNPTIKTGTQLYLAYYFPNDWTGQLTATNVVYDTVLNKVVVATAPTWDARCVLTGVSTTTGTCSTGETSKTAEAPSSRVMLTWNGSSGQAFQWASLNSTQKGVIDSGDSTQNGNRVSFLRGDRTNELTSAGACPQLTSPGLPCFRSRNSVLGDIVDSSPTWVGPPQTYDNTVAFTDALWSSATAPEAGVAYSSYAANNQTRLNVVYVGANDGFVHGFRAGSLDASGNLVNNTTTPNDGNEVLAYMPGAVFQTIHNSTPEYDYANQQYSHAWYVDATPGTGDLFYSGAWHTWLVGGLGEGGAAIYALDVTTPANFSETNASTLVIGEWSSSSITCTNVTSCGSNLGKTYGTPLIRRFHNGQWGVIWGNGFGATNTNAAGIYIMLIRPSDGAKTFYYLATPALNGAAANGIASVDTADLDLDHIVDYIYAGDLQGHVWRFDVTQQDPASWAVSTNSPLFSTPGGQPITAGLTVSTLKQIVMSNLGGQILDNTKPERVMVNFGTGQQIPQSLTLPTTYATGTQYLFGIWDWDFNAPSSATQPGWNSLSNIKAIAATAPQSISLSTLTQQTITTTTPTPPAVAYRTVSNNAVCWLVPSTLDGSSSCPTYPTAGTKFGWYMTLPGTQEQVIFNPIINPDGELVVNTFIPAQDSPLSCNTASSGTGFTMGISPGTGGGQNSGTSASPTGYFQVNTNSGVQGQDGIQLNGTGIPWFLSSGQKGDNNTEYLITQTASGAAPPTPTNRHVIVAGKRLNWVQRR
jgi:type IV pilus assembly protein PilY1